MCALYGAHNRSSIGLSALFVEDLSTLIRRLMAAFTPGTGGTLHSTTMEAAALELAQLMQAAEIASTDALDNVSLTVNTDTNTASITFSLPISVSVGSDGKLQIAAVEYIT